jgi:hypothetical protein
VFVKELRSRRCFKELYKLQGIRDEDFEMVLKAFESCHGYRTRFLTEGVGRRELRGYEDLSQGQNSIN